MSKIIYAVDQQSISGSLGRCRSLSGRIWGIKLGIEFTTANGPDGVRQMVALGLPVFLDLKFHDIPNTVAGAVRAAAALDVAMMTLHVAGGPAMLRAAVEAAGTCDQRPWLLGVTVLTSCDDADLSAIGIPSGTCDQVLRLADLASTCGLDGVICSPHEISMLRERFDIKLVVPGIRPNGSELGDQKRTMTQEEAISLGADYLVIGRGMVG